MGNVYKSGKVRRNGPRLIIVYSFEADKVVSLSKENRKVKVLRLAANEYVARDRRWRCRIITFGFAWRLTKIKNKKKGCGTLSGGDSHGVCRFRP